MDVLQLIREALSDKYIATILGADANNLRYSELRHITDVDELLTKDPDYCIRNQAWWGIWAALSKYNGMYEHFDSYGAKPDKSPEWVNLKMRQRMNDALPYLTNLLKNKQYIYNHVKYQDRDGYVNTCGSHVVHRLHRLKNDGVGLQTYYKIHAACSLSEAI